MSNDNVHIEWLGLDGVGGGKSANGKVVRVKGTLPGDVVTAKPGPPKEPFEVSQRIAASVDRAEASCALHAACGGCDLAEARPDARKRWLSETIRRRLGGTPAPQWTASPRSSGHRARINMTIRGATVGYQAHRSHDLVDVLQCPIARPEVNLGLTTLRSWAASHPDAGLTRVEIRSDGSRAVFAFSTTGAHAAKIGRLQADSLAELGDVAIDGRTVHGVPALWLPGPVPMRASPRAFYQVNLEVNRAMTDWVIAQASDGERILDLYAGIGNFALNLAKLDIPVIAVEREGQATGDLLVSAENAGLTGVKAVRLPVERFDPSREMFDVAIVDPPRAGAPGVLDKVVLNRPKRVIYVCCHLPSAIRDIRALTRAGYRLTDVHCFDMFPDTHHVESGLVFDR